MMTTKVKTVPKITKQIDSIYLTIVEGIYKLYIVEDEYGNKLAYPLDKETGLICNYAFDLNMIGRAH